MEKGPKRKSFVEAMSGFFGVDITNAPALKKHFNMHAKGGVSAPAMDEGLYRNYTRLYQLSYQLAQALETVLRDSEHQLVMQEARQMGYELPDRESFRAALHAYKIFLKNHQLDRDADRLQALADKNCDMVSEIFAGCFKTEYMAHFGFLKRRGFHYAGATALQEAVDVISLMSRIKGQIDRMNSEHNDDKPPSAPRP